MTPYSNPSSVCSFALVHSRLAFASVSAAGLAAVTFLCKWSRAERDNCEN